MSAFDHAVDFALNLVTQIYIHTGGSVGFFGRGL
jgi:hypothetical protein